MSKSSKGNNRVCCPKVEEIARLREAQQVFGANNFQPNNWYYSGYRAMRNIETPTKQQTSSKPKK